jgi:hypothetical protein
LYFSDSRTQRGSQLVISGMGFEVERIELRLQHLSF